MDKQKTPWLSAEELIEHLEEHKVAHPLTFGYKIVDLMRWNSVRKLVLEPGVRTSSVRYTIKKKAVWRSGRYVCQFQVTTKKIDRDRTKEREELTS